MDLSSIKKSEDLAKDLDQFQSDLERLRFTYENYFLGLDKIAPVKLRGTVVGWMKRYSGTNIQNARLKFRYQQIVARYNTYAIYWDRVLKEIEEGRYARDLFKARIHERQRTESEKWKAARAEKPAAGPALPEDPFVAVFNAFLSERSKNSEPAAQIPFEKFRAQLDGQISAIKQKTGAAEVRLQVVTEAGKAKIKAVPRPPKKA